MRRQRRRELRPPIGSTELPSIQRLDTWILRYGPAGDTPAGPQLGLQLWALRPGLDGTSRPSTTSHGTPWQTRDPVAAGDPFGGVVMSTPRAPGPLCPEPAVARQS